MQEESIRHRRREPLFLGRLDPFGSVGAALLGKSRNDIRMREAEDRPDDRLNLRALAFQCADHRIPRDVEFVARGPHVITGVDPIRVRAPITGSPGFPS